LAVLLMSMIAGGCQTNPVTGERELIIISRAQEIALGEEAAPKFEEEFGGRVPNEELQEYIRMVGAKLAASSDREMPYEYTLVASDIPNAFALPGGKIFITAGLMRLMKNEQQLAAVLGHETAHVAALHNVKGLQRQMGAAVLIEVAGKVMGRGAGAAKAAAKVVTTMVNLEYTREQELEADEYGLKYMTRAGYNPWGMVELLTILLNLREQEPGRLEQLFQTHPPSSERIAETEKHIGREKEYEGFRSETPDAHADRFARMHQLLPQSLPEKD